VCDPARSAEEKKKVRAAVEKRYASQKQDD
jgi:hypothetical protein